MLKQPWFKKIFPSFVFILTITAVLLYVYANPFLRLDNVVLGEITNQWAYPNLFTRISLSRLTFPIWDQYTLGGYPFIGNPQNQLFYPISSLAILLFSDQILGMRWIFFTHLLLTAVFITMLLRLFTRNLIVVTSAVIVSLCNNYYLICIANGMPAEIFSLTWMPLMFFFLIKWERTNNLWQILWASIAFSLLIYSGALFGVYFAFISAYLFFLFIIGNNILKKLNIRSYKNIIFAGIIFLVAIGIFSAPRLLPILEFRNYSMRSNLPLDGTLGNSYSWQTFISYLQGFIQQMDFSSPYMNTALFFSYMGFWLLFVLSLFIKCNRLFTRFLVVLIIVASMGMLGKNAPLVNIYAFFYHTLPGFTFNEHPGRLIMLIYFSLPLITGLSLADLTTKKQPIKSLAYLLASFLIITSIITTKQKADNVSYQVFPKQTFLSKKLQENNSFYRWHDNAIGLNYGPQPYMALLYNQLTVNPSYSQMLPVNSYDIFTLLTKNVDKRFISRKYKTLSILGVAYEVEQKEYFDFEIPNTYAQKIETHDAISIYKLKKYAQLVYEIQTPIALYTTPEYNMHSVKTRALFLDFIDDPLTTSFISSPESQKEIPGNIPMIIDASTKKNCQNNYCMTISFKPITELDVRRQLSSLYSPIHQEVELEETSKKNIKKLLKNSLQKKAKITNAQLSSGKITFTVENKHPAFLSISQRYYPGWEARIDGKKTEIFLNNGLIQAIYIDTPGKHQVSMNYYSQSFYAGLIIFFLGIPPLLFLIRRYQIKTVKTKKQRTVQKPIAKKKQF